MSFTVDGRWYEGRFSARRFVGIVELLYPLGALASVALMCVDFSCPLAQESGYSLTDDELNRAFIRFKGLADKKKDITSLDLASIVNDEIRDVNIRRYELVGMQVRHAGID